MSAPKTETHAHAAAPPNSAHMIAALAGIAVLSGLLVVTTHELTLEPIAENRRAAIERAVFRVLPGAESRVTFLATPEGPVRIESADTPGEKLYAGYDAAGQLVGVAIEAAAQGYQDVIRALYGYDPDREIVRGFTVLESRETPGLGDKIARDPDFLRNFEALDVRLNPAGDGLLHPVVTVGEGSKESPWEIDGITGATISAQAVGRMINDTIDRLAPYVQRHRAAFEMEAAP